MIAVLGSINLDLTATTPRLPEPGETIAGHTFATAPGGKGANQALAAARAGAVVRMFGCVGNDVMADQALAELDAAGVDIESITRENESTGIAMILVDDAGENAITIVAGANGLVDDVIAEECVAELEPGDILMLQQEIPSAAIRAALELAAENQITTVLNIAPFNPDDPDLYQLANVVIANETEFAQLTRQSTDPDELEEVAAAWAEMHNKILVLTLGAQGAIAATPDGAIRIEALPITPVDTVGAGDTFCGYLAAALDQRLPLETALTRAGIAGSLACLKPGAQPAIPTLQEVTDALRTGSI